MIKIPDLDFTDELPELTFEGEIELPDLMFIDKNSGPADMEIGLKEQENQKQLTAQLTLQQEQMAQQAAADPKNWTLQQTKDFFKQNPPKTPQEEAQRDHLLDQKKTLLDSLKTQIDVEQAPRDPGLYADYGQGRPPTPKEAALMDSVRKRQDWNALPRSAKFDIIYGNLADKAFPYLITAPAAPIFWPWLAGFDALQQAKNALYDASKGTLYDPFEDHSLHQMVQPLFDMIPESGKDLPPLPAMAKEQNPISALAYEAANWANKNPRQSISLGASVGEIILDYMIVKKGLMGSKQLMDAIAPTPEVRDAFSVFGLSPNATTRELTERYHQMAMTNHPDRGGNPENFNAIERAWRTIQEQRRTGVQKIIDDLQSEEGFARVSKGKAAKKPAQPPIPTEGAVLKVGPDLESLAGYLNPMGQVLSLRGSHRAYADEKGVKDKQDLINGGDIRLSRLGEKDDEYLGVEMSKRPTPEQIAFIKDSVNSGEHVVLELSRGDTGFADWVDVTDESDVDRFIRKNFDQHVTAGRKDPEFYPIGEYKLPTNKFNEYLDVVRQMTIPGISSRKVSALDEKRANMHFELANEAVMAKYKITKDKEINKKNEITKTLFHPRAITTGTEYESLSDIDKSDVDAVYDEWLEDKYHVELQKVQDRISDEVESIIPAYVSDKTLLQRGKWRKPYFGGGPAAGGMGYRPQVVEPFYSAVASKLMEKMPLRASADQVRGILKEASPTELDWLDIEDYLKTHPQVDRKDIVDYVNAHIMKVTKTELKTKPLTYEEARSIIDSIQPAQRLENLYGLAFDVNPDDPERMGFRSVSTEGDLADGDIYDMGDLRQMMADGVIPAHAVDLAADTLGSYKHYVLSLRSKTTTKWMHYQQPGGTNYREILLSSAPKTKAITKNVPVGGLSRYNFSGLDKQPVDVKFGVRSRLQGEGYKLTWEEAKPRVNQTTYNLMTFLNRKHGIVWDTMFALPVVRHNKNMTDILITGYDNGGKMYTFYRRPGPTGPGSSLIFVNGKRMSMLEFIGHDEVPQYDREFLPGTTKKVTTTTPQHFRGGHWSEYNVPDMFAHARVTDRLTSEGKKVLFLEELQSDWAIALRQKHSKNIPFTPFEKMWLDVDLKNALRTAAEEGYDYLSWVTGNQQNQQTHMGIDKAEALYDEMIPEFLDKYVKRWGSKVENIVMSTPAPDGTIIWQADTNDIYVETFGTGYKLKWKMPGRESEPYQSKIYKDDERDAVKADACKILVDSGTNARLNYNMDVLKSKLAGYTHDKMMVNQAVPITDQMKQVVLYQGQPITGKGAEPAEEVIGRGNMFRIAEDTTVTNTRGQQITLPKGEEYTAYMISQGKVRLQDGKQVTIYEGELSKLKGQILQGAPMAGGTGLKEESVPEDEDKRRKFIDTVKEAEKTKPEVAAGVESRYDPIGNEATLQEAKTLLAADYNAALDMVMGPSTPTRVSNAVAILLIDKAQHEGRFADAISLVNRTAEKQTALGQTIQALSMYRRLSPEGILQFAASVRRQAIDLGAKIPKDLPPEMAEAFRTAAEEIAKMPEGRQKDIETALLIKEISKQVPTPLLSKISMLQTMSQLLNPKTMIRNLLGNLGFMTMENIAETFATALDVATAMVTGKRTVALPMPGVQVKGLKEGAKTGAEESLLGINLKKMGQRFDLPKNTVFDDGVLGALEKILSLALRAPDQAFYQAAFNQSIMQQCKLAGVEDPTPEMIDKAHYEGLYRTFQDDNVVSRLFVALKKALNVGKGWGLGDMVVKYPKTPANLLARGIEYSPFGMVRSLFRLAEPLFGKAFNQEDFVRSTARAFTGSTFGVGLGALLAGLGIITGRRDKDADVRATRQGVGIRDYQINVSALKRFVASGFDPMAAKMREDDTLVSYDWFLPHSITVAMGANMVLSPDRSITDRILNLGERVLEASETLAEQPLVRGLKTLTSKEEITLGLADVMKDIPASFMPTILNQVRQLTDNVVRNTRDPNFFAEMGKKAINRLPGVSRMLPEQITNLGRPREMYQMGSNNPFNVFLNPAFINKYKPDPVSRMVLDIFEATGQKGQFPRIASRKITMGGVDRVLTPDEYEEYQRYIGEKTNVLFNILANNPAFMNRPDEEKAKKLQKYLTDINTGAKIDLFGYKPAKISKDVMWLLRSIGYNKRVLETEEMPDLNFENMPELQFAQ